MLKPDRNDPNYKELMKQYDKDAASWGPDRPTPANPVPGPTREELIAELTPQIETEVAAKLQAQFDDGVQQVRDETREELLKRLPKKLREQVEAVLVGGE